MTYDFAYDLGWMGWPIGYCARLNKLARSHMQAFLKTRTGVAAARGERPPRFPMEGARDATLFVDVPVPIRISADERLIQNRENGRVAFLADIPRDRIEEAAPRGKRAAPAPKLKLKASVLAALPDAKQRSALKALAEVAATLAIENRRHLDDLKQQGKEIAEQEDFLWHLLLQSFATMGGSSGAQRLLENPELAATVTYDALAALSPAERSRAIQHAVRTTGLRWPTRKATYLLGCWARIEELGGLAKAQRTLLNLPGGQAKLELLRSLPGIGEKYARNIMMDLAHPDLANVIAIDQRIESVSKAAGLWFASYKEHERFYLAVAEAAGLSGWELDRLLYNHTARFLKAVE